MICYICLLALRQLQSSKCQLSCVKESRLSWCHVPMGHAGTLFCYLPNLGCIAWLRGWENNQRDCVKNNSCHILSPQSAGRCFGILTGCRRCHATGHWPELTPGHQEGHWQHRSHWHLTEQFIDSSVPDGVCLNPLLICLHFGNV